MVMVEVKEELMVVRVLMEINEKGRRRKRFYIWDWS